LFTSISNRLLTSRLWFLSAPSSREGLCQFRVLLNLLSPAQSLAHSKSEWIKCKAKHSRMEDHGNTSSLVISISKWNVTIILCFESLPPPQPPEEAGQNCHWSRFVYKRQSHLSFRLPLFTVDYKQGLPAASQLPTPNLPAH
jgi:hypothetical protein